MARASVCVQAAGRSVWSHQHLAGALRLLVLLLVVLLQLGQWLVLLRGHLLLQVWMHLHELALRCWPAMALAWMLALRLGSRLVHRLLLVRHLLLQHIRIAAVQVLDVDDVLVLFVLAIIIVVIGVSLLVTHYITARIRVMIHSLFVFVSFARKSNALIVALHIDRQPLLLLQLLEVLPCDALGATGGCRPLLAAGVAIRVRFKLCDGELSWQVEALIVALVLLSEELLPVVVEVLRERKIADDLGGVRLLG